MVKFGGFPDSKSDRLLADLLAQRQFVRFWLARLNGTMANQMLMVAVAWQMYDITSSAWDLGLVGLFQFVPALLMTLPAGHVADRLHRGRIFATCMMIQAAIALLLPAATEGNFASRGLILGVSVVLGVVRAFQVPAQQALTPLLVPEELLPRAIALSSIGVQTAIVCGPALGGLLYATGATVVYVSGAILSLLSSVLTWPFAITIGASNQLGEFESGATAALFGPVGSVVLGGIGTVLVAITWFRLFPALAQRDHMIEGAPGSS